MKSKIVRVYVDGAYSSLSKRGAAAFVVTSYNYDVLHEEGEAYIKTTGQRMELWAGINAIEWCTKNIPDLRPVIYTDSEYLKTVRYAIPHWRDTGWLTRQGEPVKNIDLVLMLGLRMLDNPHNVEVCWLRGHNGEQWNERAHDVAEGLTMDRSTAREDVDGGSLLTTSDMLRICRPEHINRVIQYSYRIDVDMAYLLSAAT